MLTAPSETGTDFEHRASIFGRDQPPILNTKRLTSHPPLETLRDTQSTHQLRDQADDFRLGTQEAVNLGHDVSGRHQGGKETKLAVQCFFLPSVFRIVQNIVDN